MIIFNGLNLIGIAVMFALLIICGIALVINHIVYTVKKRKQKHIKKMKEKRNVSITDKNQH